MTHAHRKRRGVMPRPSARHLILYRRMAERAVKLADRVRRRGAEGAGADAASLAKAAEKTGKAILPVGHQNPDSPFMRLYRLALSLRAARPADLAAGAAVLGALGAACLEVLDRLAEAGSAPARRDIEG